MNAVMPPGDVSNGPMSLYGDGCTLHDGAAADLPNGPDASYRCYVIHHGRIAKAIELTVATLDEAVLQGRAILDTDPAATTDSGIEVWQRAALLYTDRCHAMDTGRPSLISSPFATLTVLQRGLTPAL